MDMTVLGAAEHALFILMDPHRLLYLFAGVCMGLGLGILPGIGGVAGTALLLPFTYSLDPPTAFALLLGLGASTTTADPITAILFGVPGHAASAATTLDGYPLTQQGFAGRALGASYMAALIGGLFGAALLAVTLPVLRPIMLSIGSPELLALAVFGMSMVAVLSGNAPLKGLTGACFGVMLSMIGTDPQTGTPRWTLDSLYLYDGLPLVPLTLGIFALPELCDLAISRTPVVSGIARLDTKTGMLMGVHDVFRNWFLILRCSWLGAAVGAIPGIGASVIDWLSYGHALKTEKGARETFGKGDIRGVIAAESATNAREGGALVPTVAFGVPASAGMAILLGAFLMHGLVPGPDMLSKNLDVTYAMVWSIALANILGSGLCFLFSGQLARLATLRHTLILPVVLSLIYIGAFEGTRQWGDLYSLLFFGLLGWGMKHLRWPRPPLVLGFILGKILERYLFISIARYGTHWMLRPAVLALFLLTLASLLRPLLQDVRRRGFGVTMRHLAEPRFTARALFPAALVILFAAMLTETSSWTAEAKIVPMIVGSLALLFGTLAAISEFFRRTAAAPATTAGGPIHMDITSRVADLPTAQKFARGGAFFGWIAAFLGSMATLGLIPTVPIFIVAYMRIEGRERWSLTVPMAAVMTLFIYALFDRLLAIPWPPSLIGELLPALKAIPSV
ncbi:MAG TPA: tripartite tricarboxylate transporter permease [Stellaceae bacterium]|nr:tripartite tricarboxylate transporter permease [Stellaceae bacterium]